MSVEQLIEYQTLVEVQVVCSNKAFVTMYELLCTSCATRQGSFDTNKQHNVNKLHKLDLPLQTECSVQPPSLSFVESSKSTLIVWLLLHLLEALGTVKVTVQGHLKHDLGSGLPHGEACMLLNGVPEVCGGGVVTCVEGRRCPDSSLS